MLKMSIVVLSLLAMLACGTLARPHIKELIKNLQYDINFLKRAFKHCQKDPLMDIETCKKIRQEIPQLRTNFWMNKFRMKILDNFHFNHVHCKVLEKIPFSYYYVPFCMDLNSKLEQFLQESEKVLLKTAEDTSTFLMKKNYVKDVRLICRRSKIYGFAQSEQCADIDNTFKRVFKDKFLDLAAQWAHRGNEKLAKHFTDKAAQLEVPNVVLKAEERAVKFDRPLFLKYNNEATYRNDHQLWSQYEVMFSTTHTDGIILLERKGASLTKNFQALSVVDGHLELCYNLGHDTLTIRSTVYVADGKWHTAKLYRNRQSGGLQVDSEVPLSGSSGGTALSLSSDGYVRIGGAADLATSSLNTTLPFIGCIKTVEKSGQSLDLVKGHSSEVSYCS